MENDIDMDLTGEALDLADDLVILIGGIATISDKDYELLRTTLNSILKTDIL